MNLEERLAAAKASASALHDVIVREEGRIAEVATLMDGLVAANADLVLDINDDVVCVQLLQGLESIYQAKFQDKVAKIISRGLTLVFEEPMELKIVTKIRNDLTTVDFRLVQPYGKGDTLETGLVGAKGGTVIALLNVLMRILLILSAHPPMRRFLELDEPFGQADTDMIPAFGELLRSMSQKLGFQIIIVTHEKVLVDIGDTAYQVYRTRNNGAAFEQLHARNERVA